MIVLFKARLPAKWMPPESLWQIYHYERRVGCFNLMALLVISRGTLKAARSASGNK